MKNVCCFLVEGDTFPLAQVQYRGEVFLLVPKWITEDLVEELGNRFGYLQGFLSHKQMSAKFSDLRIHFENFPVLDEVELQNWPNAVWMAIRSWEKLAFFAPEIWLS